MTTPTATLTAVPDAAAPVRRPRAPRGIEPRRSRGTTSAGRRRLTAHQIEILELMALGLANKAIGKRLFLSPLTVKSHKARIATALGACGETSHSVAIGYACGYLSRFPRPIDADPKVTARERQVLAAVAHGLTNAQIARSLFLSEDTVKTHMVRTMKKLGARGRANAVLIALQLGVLPVKPRAQRRAA